MSLQIVISAEEQANSFFVYDCTGSQSSENPGGWGGTNPKLTDIKQAVLTITPPQLNLPTHLTVGQVDTMLIAPVPPPTYSISTYPDFPNATDNDLGYEVLPFMVGTNNNVIPSGKWKITLTVSGTYGPNNKPFSSSGFVYKVFKKTVTCCVDKLQKQINVSNYKDKRSVTINELNNLLESADKAIGCGLLDQANGIIRLLNEQCQCVDC